MISRTADITCHIMLAIAVASLVCTGVLTLAEIVSRSAFDKSLLITEQLVEYLLSLSIFAALPSVFRMGRMLRVSLLTARLPNRAVRVLDLLALMITLFVTSVLAWFTGRATVLLFERETQSTGIISYPLWISEATIFASLLVLITVLAIMCIETVSGHNPANEKELA